MASPKSPSAIMFGTPPPQHQQQHHRLPLPLPRSLPLRRSPAMLSPLSAQAQPLTLGMVNIPFTLRDATLALALLFAAHKAYSRCLQMSPNPNRPTSLLRIMPDRLPTATMHSCTLLLILLASISCITRIPMALPSCSAVFLLPIRTLRLPPRECLWRLRLGP
jgi:hypothetical protein